MASQRNLDEGFLKDARQSRNMKAKKKSNNVRTDANSFEEKDNSQPSIAIIRQNYYNFILEKIDFLTSHSIKWRCKVFQIKKLCKFPVLIMFLIIILPCLSCKKDLPNEMFSVDYVKAEKWIDPICNWTYISLGIKCSYILNEKNGYIFSGTIDWGNGHVTPLWENYLNKTNGSIMILEYMCGQERVFPNNSPFTYQIKITFTCNWELCKNVVVTTSVTI